MKNLKYYSFERNKYFYGKLLSVDDFETEQRYMNDKRRLINRFVNGCGVICGMNVVAVDDVTISIERGMALDFAGREIVIDNPEIKKLSMIDGFEECTNAVENESDIYLCIGYSEENKEAVHNIAGNRTAGTDEIEFNKFVEGHTLFLTNKEPDSDTAIVDRFYKDSKILYRGNGFRITQEVTKYIESNEECDIKIIVEKYGQTKPIWFQYDLELNCMQDNDASVATITFDEEKFEKSNKYEIYHKIKALAVIEAVGHIKLIPGSFQMSIGKKKINVEAKYETNINISHNDIREQIINQYYQNMMDDIVQNTFDQNIYLARLSVVKAGSTYIIDAIDNMPFNQYLMNNVLSTVLNHMDLEYGYSKKMNGITSSGKKSNSVHTYDSGSQLISTGVTVIDLGIGGSAGQRFYSNDIVHGLGLGTVTIMLGSAYSMKENSTIVFGDQDIFSDREDKVKAKLAAKVNTETGKFVIGLKCIEPTDERQVRIHWMAIKDKQDVIYEQVKDVMHIKPDMLNLRTKESHYFEAIIGMENESRVKWSIKENDGGIIDENGMYTAPNRQGVFEILAESMDNPQMKASTFVVVRDKK